MSRKGRCLRGVVTLLLAVLLVAAWCGSPLRAGEGKKADRPSRRDKAAEAKRAPSAERKPAPPAARTPEKPSRPVAAPAVLGAHAVARRAIEAALEQPTVLELTEEPLVNVVSYLQDYHKIAVQIDTKALDEVGVATDSLVTVNLKGVSLRSAQDLLLRPMGLVFTIYDEVLLITTPDQRDSYLTVDVYEVGDLVACRDEKGQPWDDYDTLVKLITSQIEPTSWDAVGGPAAISPAPLGSAKALVVTHHSEVHYQIEQLFSRIRAIAAKSKGDGKPPTRPRPEPKKREG